jgi:hypothetical protein
VVPLSGFGVKSDIDNDNLRDARCSDGGAPRLDATRYEDMCAVL